MIGLKALECAFSPWETAKGYPDIYLHSFFYMHFPIQP